MIKRQNAVEHVSVFTGQGISEYEPFQPGLPGVFRKSGESRIQPVVGIDTPSDVNVPNPAFNGFEVGFRQTEFFLDPGILEQPDDLWLRPYEKDWGVEEAMQAYLTWEVALVEQIERDGTAAFRLRSEFPAE